jgi:hypothetical protein
LKPYPTVVKVRLGGPNKNRKVLTGGGGE